MLHSLKRKTKFRTEKQEPVNAEFDHVRQSLDNVSKALTGALTDIDQAEKSWRTLVSSSEHFSSGLHSLYPQDDDVRNLFKKTIDDVGGPLTKEMADATDAKSKVKTIERMVRAYLTEIKTLAAEYSKVETARKDFAIYQTKVDKLGKKEAESSKQSRNLDKLENSRATYNSVLEGTTHRMKTTYEKAPTMFRAAYVAYWLYHSTMSSIVTKHFKPSFDYAKAHADHLFSMSQGSPHASSSK